MVTISDRFIKIKSFTTRLFYYMQSNSRTRATGIGVGFFVLEFDQAEIVCEYLFD